MQTRVVLQWLQFTRTRTPFPTRLCFVLLLFMFFVLGCILTRTYWHQHFDFPTTAQVEVSIISLQEEKTTDPFALRHHRLQFWSDGYCISVSKELNKHLVVDFCNPTVIQTFSLYHDGRLIFDEEDLCVTTKTNSSQLILTDCEEDIVTPFNLNISGTNITLQHKSEQTTPLCLSTTASAYTIYTQRKRGDQVILTKCHDELSRLNLLVESVYLRENKALLVPPPKDTLCVGSPACATNNRPGPVKLVPSNGESNKCSDLTKCLTVVTKTARRPLLVLRMAQSIRDMEGHDLPIIAYDDGPGNYSEDVWGEIERFPHLRYIISNDEDLGISKGRNLAIKEVKTKYFLLVDDDNVFNKLTNLKKMIKILETTDAALVGGKFTNYRDYSGYMRVSTKFDKAVMTLYMGSCLAANQTIVNFPKCVRCDLTSNVFITKPETILGVGGWSEELKVGEHKDIFLKLKALGHKVVYCPNFQVFNKKPTQKGELNVKGYNKLRKGARLSRMKHLFAHRWNIEYSAEKKAKHYNFKLLDKKPAAGEAKKIS